MKILKNKRNILIMLILIEITSIVFMYKSNSNKDTILDNVKLKEEISKMNGIAIMLEQEDGTYIESSSNNWPTDMYFNEELSGCVDNLGNKLENILTYENGIATVETSDTSYCVLYFDKTTNLYQLCKNYNDMNSCLVNNEEKLKDIKNLSQELQGGLYRYQGDKDIVDNNYICFGTTNTNECKNNIDKYMYRIIGISSNGVFKLIKKTGLDNTYQWNNEEYVSTLWSESLIYQALNGDDFLNNSNYFTNEWREKIANHGWRYSNFGWYTPNNNADYIYNYESSASILVTSKIGLLYLHDYYYQMENIICHPIQTSEMLDLCKSGWMNLIDNDSRYILEYTISHDTYDQTYYLAWAIYWDEGYSSTVPLMVNLAVRPVFYLESNTKLVKGTGTASNPYIIS